MESKFSLLFCVPRSTSRPRDGAGAGGGGAGAATASEALAEVGEARSGAPRVEVRRTRPVVVAQGRRPEERKATGLGRLRVDGEAGRRTARRRFLS